MGGDGQADCGGYLELGTWLSLGRSDSALISCRGVRVTLVIFGRSVRIILLN